MPTLTAVFAGTATAAAGTWTSVTNAQSTNNSTYATWSHSTRRDVGTIRLSNFGTFASIPAGSTITDVSISAWCFVSNTTNITPVTGTLGVSGTPLDSSNPGVTLTMTTANAARTWSAAVTPALSDLQANNLTVDLTFNGANNTTAATASVDAVSVTVTYDLPSVNWTQTPADDAGLHDGGSQSATAALFAYDDAGTADTATAQAGAAPTGTTWTRAPVDSAGSSDGVARPGTALIVYDDVTAADTAATSVNGAGTPWARTATDGEALTDTATAARGAAVTVTDTAGVADTGSAAAHTVAADDTTGLADNLSLPGAKTQAATDPLALTDSTTLDRGETATEPESLTDSWTLDQSKQATDLLALTDQTATSVAHTVTVTDNAATAADSQVYDQTHTVTDPLAVTDAAQLSQVSAGAIIQTDTAGLVDSITIARTINLGDTEGLTDSPAIGQSRTVTDNEAVTDQAVTDYTHPGIATTASDTAAVTDSITVEFWHIIADSFTLGDLATIARTTAVFEQTGLTDSVLVVGNPFQPVNSPRLAILQPGPRLLLAQPSPRLVTVQPRPRLELIT